MIQTRVTGNFDPIIRYYDALSRPDFGPLAHAIGTIMVEGNRRGLLAGTDKDGNTLKELKESTIRRGRGGDGEPLNPQGEGSRAIKDFEYRVEEASDRTLVIGSWPNTPYIHIHATPNMAWMATRDIIGIRPQDVDLMREAVDDFCRTLIGGRP